MQSLHEVHYRTFVRQQSPPAVVTPISRPFDCALGARGFWAECLGLARARLGRRTLQGIPSLHSILSPSTSLGMNFVEGCILSPSTSLGMNSVEGCILSGVRLEEPNEVEGRPFDFGLSLLACLPACPGVLPGPPKRSVEGSLCSSRAAKIGRVL